MSELITLRLEDINGNDFFILKKIPTEKEWEWVFGSELYIGSKKYIYCENNELGLVFYDKSTGIMKYLDMDIIKENKNIQNKEIKVVVPEPKKLVENYLKGLIIYTLYLTKDINVHKKELEYYKTTIKFLSEFNKSLNSK